MLDRCYNERCKSYPRYGGRGISVCAKWHSFASFLEDMGEKPDSYSIEREDVNGNYEKINCIWIPMKDQANNRRDLVFIEHAGLRLHIAEWSRRTMLPRAGISYRLSRGYPPGRVLGLEI